jgi:hypothetical protein
MYFFNPRLAADLFDGEYIIANLDTGLYYSVQGIAVSLLNALPFQDYGQIAKELAAAFPENSTIIDQELNLLLNELLEEEIIKKDDSVSEIASQALIFPNEYIPSRLNRYADMQDLLMLDPIHDVDEEGWTVQNNENTK